MSKRKDIELLHQVTGLPYSTCRRRYKESGEDVVKALGIENVIEVISKTLPEVIETLTEVIIEAAKIVTDTMREILKSIEEVNNNG